MRLFIILIVALSFVIPAFGQDQPTKKQLLEEKFGRMDSQIKYLETLKVNCDLQIGILKEQMNEIKKEYDEIVKKETPKEPPKPEAPKAPPKEPAKK